MTDWLMPFLHSQLGSIARSLLKVFAGWLVAHAALSASNADAFVSANTDVVLALASYALGQGLSWVTHRQQAQVVTAALALPPQAVPPGASPTQILRAADLLPKGD